MTDPRLNSVHLEFPRREDFRRARGMLLGARGMQTVALEKHEEQLGGPSRTMREEVVDAETDRGEYWLMCRDGVYPLKIGVNTIGRLPDNDVVIPGPYVSRRHCAILVHAGDGCELYDIASKNGTYINGNRLSGPTHLSAGDEIRMCDRHFVFMTKKGTTGQPEDDNTKAD
ncbi:MAG TPA: FHA domain-containing protein [Gemmataceae bacterium]|jgi:hypothetical protein|nr:FHA domain-containing protein [Gemmataceae bacterium]